jgi:probable HAF family extracellular repeat protein
MGRVVDLGAYESVPPTLTGGVYRVIDLGALGGLYSEAKAINNNGQIVGPADTEEGIGHACLFVHGNPSGNIDLGTLGGRGSIACAINNLGQVVGSSNFGWGEKASAVLFDATGAGANIDLGTAEERSSGAYGINDLGQIVGGTFHANGRWRATLFDPAGGGANINLGNLGAYVGNDDSVALAINNQGRIVGHAQYQSGSSIYAHAALFDPTGGGANVHLGGSEATAVNEAGQIVGAGDGQAMLFDAAGGLNNRTLGLPEEALWGRAYGVNARGRVVGSVTYADPEQDFVDHAVLFDLTGDRPPIDLNTLIDRDSGWVLRCANDINDRGWIVGLGINPQGRHRAFLLVPGSRILHVDDSATGANNGSSWQDALTSLEDALAAAIPGTEIRVAQGIYGPEDSGGSYGQRKTAFELRRGVTIKGGCAGNGAVNPDARDTAAYASILRGGVSGDRADATTVLDGVVITGSGMHNIGGEPTVIGCTFEGNSNPTGGAVVNIDADPTFINCVFRNNRATDDDHGGGAMYNSNSNAIVSGCRFVGNFAEGNGGGIWNTGGSKPVLTRCIFAGNGSNGGGAGGAICNMHGSRPTLTNCTFVSNRDSGCAWGSGGMYSDDYSGAAVLNCIFRGNTYVNVANEAGQIDGGDVRVNYSCVEGWTGGLGGVGNIGVDPRFATAGHWEPAGEPLWPWDDLWVDGDYHLMSQAGRWDAAQGQWVQDEATSPCIDAGDPMSAIMHEPFPNGGIVNMGAHGGTAEASKSWFGGPVCEVIIVGDLNGDCIVSLGDMALMAAHWLQDGR